MTWGACARACANTTAAGFTDWRMPTLFELIDLAAYKDVGNWSVSVWTRTPYGMYGIFPSGMSNMSLTIGKYYGWRASDGKWGYGDASWGTSTRCACVR